MARFPDWTAAEVVTAAKMDKGEIDYILKTADESVTSSATLQDDNHLAATIGNTGSYSFKAILMGTSAANAAGDLNIGFTFPTGTCYVFGDGPTASLASGSSDQVQLFAGTATSGVAFASYGLSTTSTRTVIRGLLIASATGTLQLQWSQASSNANASTIKAGSHLMVRQVA